MNELKCCTNSAHFSDQKIVLFVFFIQFPVSRRRLLESLVLFRIKYDYCNCYFRNKSSIWSSWQLIATASASQSGAEGDGFNPRGDTIICSLGLKVLTAPKTIQERASGVELQKRFILIKLDSNTVCLNFLLRLVYSSDKSRQ